MELKNIKYKLFFSTIFIILFIAIGTVKSNAGNLLLNNLEFDVQINNDGSMNVKEIWDIDIVETNTLYKTFETDSSKYSKITDILVKEITDERMQVFSNQGKWKYHADKDSYYGDLNSDRKL